jgi:hypothetical protein
MPDYLKRAYYLAKRLLSMHMQDLVLAFYLFYHDLTESGKRGSWVLVGGAVPITFWALSMLHPVR